MVQDSIHQQYVLIFGRVPGLRVWGSGVKALGANVPPSKANLRGAQVGGG